MTSMPIRTARGHRPAAVMAVIAAMAATAISSGAVVAADPGNDVRQDATHISTLGTEFTGSTATATSAGEPAPSCGSGVGKTVWFRFRAPIALNLDASTASSDFDTVLQVYVATANGVSRVKCNDDAFGISTPSEVNFNAAAGKLYYIQLGGYLGDSGNYTFYLDGIPRNDSFANAAVAKTLPFSYQESTSGAIGQVGEPLGCGIKAHSVWFKYKRSTNASVSADTFGSDFDTRLALYEGTAMGSLFLIDCNDDSGGTPQSQVTWNAVGGDTYYVQIVGATNLSEGSLTFTITRN